MNPPLLFLKISLKLPANNSPLTFSKLCLREEHLFNHSMAASNTVSSLGTLRRSLARISVSLSTHRDRNSSWRKTGSAESLIIYVRAQLCINSR